MNYEIVEMTDADASAVLEIFKQGIESGNATFDTSVPDWETWDKNHLPICRFVLKNENEQVVGFCALKSTSNRECFKGVAEVSIYIHKDFQNLGLGAMLLNKLILDSEEHGFWTLQSGIFPENKPSIAVHLKYGFRIVGTRENIGFLNGVWRDVVIMERRSRNFESI